MRKFILHGEMADLFCHQITLNASTVREVIEALSANFSGFRPYFINKLLKGVNYSFFDLNGREVESFYMDIPLTEHEYDILPSLQGSSGNAGTGAALFGGNMLLGFGMQYLSNMLNPEEDSTPEYEIITTNSKIYSKNENRAEQGSPIPVVYGQLRVGSKIITSSIQNYDYDYDEAQLYEGKPYRTQLSKLINGADYTFIGSPGDRDSIAAGIQDLRMLPDSDERFQKEKDSTEDPSKRFTVNEKNLGGKKEKKYSLSLENEAINETFENNAEGSNVRMHFGPSEDGPVHTNAGDNVSWWDRQSASPRPFVYPIDGSIDVNMRPGGPNDYCVVRESRAGIEPVQIDEKCLSFKTPNKPMTVGSRGAYQKLESLGIYKSLEIISEGPIAGLANPITGSVRDNGFVNWPYGKDDFAISSDEASLGDLSWVNGSLVSAKNKNSTVEILSAGANYIDGQYDLIGNAPAHLNGMRITVESPKSTSSASIMSTSFMVPDLNSDGLPDNAKEVNGDIFYTSTNNLFILKDSDGSISPNYPSSPNSNTPIPSQDYLDPSTNVFNLKLLSEHSDSLPWSNTRYKIGKGYSLTSQQFVIEPDNEDAKFEVNLVDSAARDRKSQAACLDIGTFFQDTALFNANVGTQINDFKNSTEFTIPRTSQSWNKFPRCFLDASSIDLNSSITFLIGNSAYGCGWRNSNTCYRNISITITMKQYLSLGQVQVNGSYSNANPFGYQVWNDAMMDETNLFTSLVRGTPQNLGELLRNKNFADTVFDQFNNLSGNNLEHVVMPSFPVTKTNTITYGGGKYIKYTLGSGSSFSNGKKFSDWNFPHHILDISNNKDFEDVAIFDGGAIDKDDSNKPKGYYCPFLYPRVKVSCLRIKNGSLGGSSRSFLPTNIDAVAEVNKLGLVTKVHLLRVPDNCVYDGSSWTSIQPQDINSPKPAIIDASPSVRYQDVGFRLEVDPSHNSTSCDFIIDEGQLTLDPVNGNISHLTSITADWSSHVASRLSTAAGIFSSSSQMLYGIPNQNITRVFNIEPTSTLNNPSVKAQAQISIESIDLSSGNFKKTSINNDLAGENFNFLSTGRPTSVSLINRGIGYTAKKGNSSGSRISLEIFNKQKQIQSVEITSQGKGYKPNESFYQLGLSKTKQNANHDLFLNSAKFKIKTDQNGSIDSIDVIDNGFGFSEILNKEDLIFSSSLGRDLTPFGGGVDEGRIFASNNMSKRPLILTVFDSWVNDPSAYTSITKFMMTQEGFGFNKNQIIPNPFESVSFTPPEFRISVANGSISSVEILGGEQGYSDQDEFVELKISPPATVFNGSVDDAESDDTAWARSIYLNDVPIKDKNNRFNYSKFHFDMRIGHGKNGTGSSNLPIDQIQELAESVRPGMISDEFKLPSFTKIVQFPLYAPRNEAEKDYYYSHTIKNPEISAVTISIQINKLHYIYEGDESALYVNLIPLMMAGIAAMVGKSMKDGLVASLAVADTTLSTKAAISGDVYGNTNPCTGTIVKAMSVTNSFGGGPGGFSSMGEVAVKSGEIAKQAKNTALAATILGGSVALVLGFLLVNLFPCSKISWLCFKIGELIKNSGEIWPAKMRVAIEYGVEGGEMKKDIISFSGCSTNPYVKDILIDNLPVAEGSDNNFKNRIIKVYRTTREMDPVKNGIIEARYHMDAELHSVTEYVEGFFSYPNTAIIGTRVNAKDHPEVPVKEYLIKGRMIKVPSNYNPTSGQYTGSWDGEFKKINSEYLLQWTSNPAWIIYDLLTHPTYGMGKYNITDSDIDVWSFYRFAEFCDEKVDVIVDGKSTQERRHMCNLYVDTEKQAYEYIKDLLYIYNSSINFSGGKIYITCDFSEKDRNGSIMIFNNSNVLEDGFAYSSTPETSRITAATVDYLDERDNYMQKSEYVEDQESLKDHNYSHIKIAGIGITRRGEAHRLGWHKILSRQLEKELVTFKTGLRGSYLRIGDVVEVMDRNKSSKHSGGKITKLINTRTVELDIPTSVLTNVDHLLLDTPQQSEDLEGSRTSQFTKYEISTLSGSQVTFTSDLDSSIKAGSSWIIESNEADNIKPRQYKIKSIKESSNLEYEITALEYLESKYYYIDESTSSKNGILIEERTEQSGNSITSFDLT